MKRISIAFLTACLWTATATALTRGDVNGDGEASVADITQVVNILGGERPGDDIMARADVNGDGEVSIADVTLLVSIIMDNDTPEPQPLTGYDYVWDPTVLPEIHLLVSRQWSTASGSG